MLKTKLTTEIEKEKPVSHSLLCSSDRKLETAHEQWAERRRFRYRMRLEEVESGFKLVGNDVMSGDVILINACLKDSDVV